MDTRVAGRMGGLKSRAMFTPEERKERARKALEARWSRDIEARAAKRLLPRIRKKVVRGA
jgi:hypothetical protein